MAGRAKTSVSRRTKPEDPDPVDHIEIEERRLNLRRPTFKAGEILAEGRSHACIVRNVSETGCLIKLDNAAVLPDLVEIRIDRDRPARTAEIVWRSATLAGAMFLRKPS